MSKYCPERRDVLQGMIAAIFALCLPMPILWGAETCSGETGKTADPKKVSKTIVKYQDKPKGDQKCSTCINFIPPESCKLVEGKISANGWCNLWAQKKA